MMVASRKTALAPNQRTVEINEMIVDISTLRVSNRQVTLALFRQLPERQFLSVSNENPCEFGMTGKPWGIVRYNFDDYRHKEGFHMVFENNGILYRDYLTKNSFDKYSKNLKTSLDVAQEVVQEIGEALLVYSCLNKEKLDFKFTYTPNSKCFVCKAKNGQTFHFYINENSFDDYGDPYGFPYTAFKYNEDRLEIMASLWKKDSDNECLAVSNLSIYAELNFLDEDEDDEDECEKIYLAGLEAYHDCFKTLNIKKEMFFQTKKIFPKYISELSEMPQLFIAV